MKLASIEELLIASGKLAMLRALLTNGRATIDVIPTVRDRAFRDGGKWRGQITRTLHAKKIIEKVGLVASDRKSRHRSDLVVWGLRDAAKAVTEIDNLEFWFEREQRHREFFSYMAEQKRKRDSQSAATDADKSAPGDCGNMHTGAKISG